MGCPWSSSAWTDAKSVLTPNTALNAEQRVRQPAHICNKSHQELTISLRSSLGRLRFVRSDGLLARRLRLFVRVTAVYERVADELCDNVNILGGLVVQGFYIAEGGKISIRNNIKNEETKVM